MYTVNIDHRDFHRSLEGRYKPGVVTTFALLKEEDPFDRKSPCLLINSSTHPQMVWYQ
jgi:hypothetical protein